MRQLNDGTARLGKVEMVFDGGPPPYQKTGKRAYLTDKTFWEPYGNKSCQNKPDKNIYKIHQPPDMVTLPVPAPEIKVGAIIKSPPPGSLQFTTQSKTEQFNLPSSAASWVRACELQ